MAKTMELHITWAYMYWFTSNTTNVSDMCTNVCNKNTTKFKMCLQKGVAGA